MPVEAAKWSEVDETGRQLRRFLVVGLLSVATDLGVYAALGNLFSTSLSEAKAVSYLAGVMVGFGLNKLWTFQSARRTWSEPITYVLLYAMTLAVNVGCNRLALSWVDSTIVAFFFATGVTTVLNFLGMRLVTFRKGIAERRDAIASPVAQPQAA